MVDNDQPEKHAFLRDVEVEHPASGVFVERLHHG